MPTGVLLVNLGSPASFAPKDVYRYLIEFLTDPRVIDLPWIYRHLLVRGAIVPSRYQESAKSYAKIWQKEGPPLLVHGRKLAKDLQEALGKEFFVELAMRYEKPSINEGIDRLMQHRLKKLIILPLFPQYASATSGSVFEKTMAELKKFEVFPTVVFIDSFFQNKTFIDAWCKRAKEHDFNAYDHFLFSFHGLPQRQIKKADPCGSCFKQDCCRSINKDNKSCYSAQCFATAQAIYERLGLDREKCSVCFQSRLGKDPWLEPYASDTLIRLAKEGKKNLLVFSPSFVADCLETTHEIGVEYKELFIKAGGENLDLVKSLNDEPLFVESIKELVVKN